MTKPPRGTVPCHNGDDRRLFLLACDMERDEPIAITMADALSRALDAPGAMAADRRRTMLLIGRSAYQAMAMSVKYGAMAGCKVESDRFFHETRAYLNIFESLALAWYGRGTAIRDRLATLQLHIQIGDG